MQYKLISKTLEETICSKVVIDEFNYYVSDELAGAKDVFLNETNCPKEFLYKKVIATSNPNIDLPKVVDEVEELANLEIEDGCENYYDIHYGFREGYNKSQKSHPYSGEDMIEFAQIYLSRRFDNPRMSNKDIFNLWKERQIKQLKKL